MWQQSATPAPSASPPPAPTLTDIFLDLHKSLVGAAPHIFRGVLVFALFWLVAAVGRRVIARAAPRVRADTGVVLLLSRVYYYGILIFGLVTALNATGLDVSTLVAGLGLTGFALGFALKDVLSNLLSGIMLLLYRPFNLGDRIRMGEYEGIIRTIRMRDTVIEHEDGRVIIIPNTKLITEVVVNQNRYVPPVTPQAPAADATAAPSSRDGAASESLPFALPEEPNRNETADRA